MKSFANKLGLLILLLTNFEAVGVIPYFRSLQVDKENKNLRVNTLFQDRKGYVWVGTDHGLYKYDGFNFEHEIGDSSGVSTIVTAISENQSGKLLVGTQSGELWQETNSKFKKLTIPIKSPIRSIIDAGNSGLWISTYGEGIYYSSNNNFNKLVGLPDEYVYTLMLLDSNKFIAGTDLGLAIIDLKNNVPIVKVLDSKDGLPDNIVRFISNYTTDEVILGFQEKGFCFFNWKKNSFTIPDKVKDWNNGPVSSVTKLENEFWIGSEGNGIIDFEYKGDKRIRKFSREEGFGYNKVFSLFRDREGNVWVAADNKLLVTSGENVERIESSGNFQFDSIQAVTCDADGFVWFSTKSGLYRYNYIEKSGKDLLKYNIDKFKVPHIVSLFEDDWGFLWIGTFDNGLYRLNTLNGEVLRFGEKEGLVNANVISITGKDSKLWLATLGGVIVCDIVENPIEPDKITYKFSSPTRMDGPGEIFVYDVFIDSKDRVWFGTDGRGISVFTKGKFTNFSNFDNGRGKVVYTIVEDKKGNIWFSTLNHGLYRFSNNVFTNFGIKDGLRELEISGLSVDNNGNIVVVHSSGIDLINPTTFEVECIGAESGIEAIDCELNCVALDQKGNTWIGSQNGLIRFFSYKDGVSTHPLVDIRKIYTFMKPGSNLLDSVFEYNQNQISIEFIGLWFNNPAIVTYRYRLLGYSDQWIITRDRIVTFPNLPPGKYTFEVEATNNNKFVKPYAAKFNFRIKKPLWKQPWLLILITIIASGALIWFIRDREIKLRRLENLKKEKMEYQYETLKSQVNPHFLFNSFNTLITIIDQDKDLAIDYVENLSDYFRSMIQYRDKDTITLKEELNMVNTYIYLQHKRFGKYLDLQLDIPAQWIHNYRLPPLSLQLLIENAIKHNAVSHETPLYINVIASERKSLLVSNNLNAKKQTEPSTGIGLENIINRFKMLTDREVVISKSDNIFTVEVPLIEL
jgi:ligand-binding sensor domain-containing protein